MSLAQVWPPFGATAGTGLKCGAGQEPQDDDHRELSRILKEWSNHNARRLPSRRILLYICCPDWKFRLASQRQQLRPFRVKLHNSERHWVAQDAVLIPENIERRRHVLAFACVYCA